jgi:hypothetical protein
MLRLVVPSFLLLGWAFYFLSGGNDFVPPNREIADNSTVVGDAVSDADDIELSEEQITLVAAQAKTLYASMVPISATSDNANASSGERQLWTHIGNQGDIATLIDPASFVDPVLEKEAQNTRTVAAARVNFRNGPGTHHNIIGSLDRDELVEILGEPSGSWVNIRVIKNNCVGWMSASLLRE